MHWAMRSLTQPWVYSEALWISAKAEKEAAKRKNVGIIARIDLYRLRSGLTLEQSEGDGFFLLNLLCTRQRFSPMKAADFSLWRRSV